MSYIILTTVADDISLFSVLNIQTVTSTFRMYDAIMSVCMSMC